jgi:hypothetical protein
MFFFSVAVIFHISLNFHVDGRIKTDNSNFLSSYADSEVVKTSFRLKLDLGN